MSLDRFRAPLARDEAQIEAELRHGRKLTHWMWWGFPQLAVLGRSPRAKDYGMAGLAEAQGFAADAELGPRYARWVDLVLTHTGTPLVTIFGEVDALKFRSSATLFEAAGVAPCGAALDAFCDGERDPATLAAL